MSHAVDLDVYVEPLPPSSPRHRKPPKAELDAEIEEAPPPSESIKKKKGRDREKDKNRDRDEDTDKRGSAKQKELAQKAAGKGDAELTPLSTGPLLPSDGAGTLYDPSSLSMDVTTRYRMMRVKVGEKALIVRSQVQKDSAQVRSAAKHPKLSPVLSGLHFN